MSSINKTQTINLSQFEGTDKPTWLVDYNGDMLKIDQAIKNLQDNNTDRTSEITGLTNLYNELEDKNIELVARLDAGDLKDVERDQLITTIRTNISTMNSVIENIKTTINEMKNEIGEVYTGVLSVGETILTIETPNVTEDSIIDVYTDVFGLTPKSVVVSLSAKTVKLTFDVQKTVVNVKLKVGE